MSTLYEHIRVEIEDQIARLTLARPAQLNALNRALLAEIIAALDAIRDAGTARVLVLAGEGRAFCSGADLSGGASPAGDGAGFDAGLVLEQYYNPLIERLYALPMPIVAAVQGGAVGAGCMIALSADLVVAARSGYFLQAFANVGLVPDAGGMWLLPRLVGRAHALAMMMLAERIPAETALAWGLIHEMAEDDALSARVDEIAVRLAAGPTGAYALIRRGVREAMDMPLSAALAMERRSQLEAGRTADFREGVASFREKRRPRFSGD